MKAHPYAELFPMMDASELRVLAQDISNNGQGSPIIVLNGKILDGRNRYAACMSLGIDPKTKDYTGKDPLAFVLSSNLHRRHLTTSQRAMVAAGIENLVHGGDRKSDQDANLHLDNVTRKEAAEKLSVSTRSVAAAAKIIKELPKEAKAIITGKKTINAVLNQSHPKNQDTESVVDLTEAKRRVPDSIIPIWNRACEESEQLMAIVSKARSAVRQAQDEEDIIYRELNISATMNELNKAYADITRIKPYALCRTCNGLRPEKCLLCKGRGFVSKFLWGFVPEEFKKAAK